MKFQAFHVNPGEKLKKKDFNNDLSNFMSVFPNLYLCIMTAVCLEIYRSCLWQKKNGFVTFFGKSLVLMN